HVVPTNIELGLGATDFHAAINTMVSTMRDSTAATHRAADRLASLYWHNKSDRNNGRGSSQRNRNKRLKKKKDYLARFDLTQILYALGVPYLGTPQPGNQGENSISITNKTARPNPIVPQRNQDDSGKMKQVQLTQQTQEDQVCANCGKNHGDRPCRFGTYACYYCGKEGHQVKECPTRIARNVSRL
ncbi:hypothetical protein PIB30_106603, partial [Stylosanthes scabra]|nr:hypothetical protein [Stylosanthes scabra]